MRALWQAEAARSLFWRLKAKGHIMIGMTSYQEFPGRIANPYDDRHTTPQDEVIYNSLEAWLHCFRWPPQAPARTCVTRLSSCCLTQALSAAQ